MADFLDRLLLKSAGSPNGIAPRRATIFEPAHSAPRATEYDTAPGRAGLREATSSMPPQRGEREKGALAPDIHPDASDRIRAAQNSPGAEAFAPALRQPHPAGDADAAAPRRRIIPEERLVGHFSATTVPSASAAPMEELPPGNGAVAPSSEGAAQPEGGAPPQRTGERALDEILRKLRDRLGLQPGTRVEAVQSRPPEQPRAVEPESRSIKVTIGRIDVRANFEAPAPPPRSAPPRRTMSLDEYLEKRGRNQE